MASEIHNIAITDALTVHRPARHIAYTVQVSTPTRTWSVNRRYNDFIALDAELRSATSKEPPAPLPPKHWFKRTMNDEEKIRQRRVGLEVYLRTVLTTKDSRWRETFGFADFLGVPSRNTLQATQFTKMTAATWLTDHSAVAGVLRDARAALLKRDALARLADPAARAAGGEARKLLRDAGPRIDALADGLDTPAVSTLGDGERRRRDDMVAALRTEHANLLRQAEAGYRPVRTATPPPEARGPGSSSSSMTASMPGAMQQSTWAPATTGGRVFGKKAAPQETAETRPLDERGLVQLQHTTMAQQDEQLGALSGLLRKQRKMGEEISEEIAIQNEMLDQLDHDVTRTGGKLARTKRDMNRLG